MTDETNPPPWAPRVSEGEQITMATVVYQALGAASVAWLPLPTGEFNSDHARWVGDGALDALSTTMRTNIVAALREQASEALLHQNEPAYSKHDCQQNALWFHTVADWIDQEWPSIFSEGAPA